MRAQIEQRWREEKYAVLFYSQRHYNDIRNELKNPQATMSQLEQKISDAKAQPLTIGNMQNACAHMWGYFKKYATNEEKQQYLHLLNTITPQSQELLYFLATLAHKYQVSYLQNSSILQLKSFGKNSR